MALGTAAFKYLSQLTCCAAAGGSGGSLQLELSLLRLQKALLTALEGLAGLKQGGAAGAQADAGAGEGSAAAAEKLAALRGSLSRAAGAALEDEWLGQQEVAAGEAQPAEPAKGEMSRSCSCVATLLFFCSGVAAVTCIGTAAKSSAHVQSGKALSRVPSLFMTSKPHALHQHTSDTFSPFPAAPRSALQLEGPGRSHQRAPGAARQLRRGAAGHAAAPGQRGAAAGAGQGGQGSAAGGAGRLRRPQLLHACCVVQGSAGAGCGAVGGSGGQGGQGGRGAGGGAGGGGRLWCRRCGCSCRSKALWQLSFQLHSELLRTIMAAAHVAGVAQPAQQCSCALVLPCRRLPCWPTRTRPRRCMRS
jgi:hypothetical protein